MWCCGYLHPVCLEATYVFWAHHCQHSPISRLIYSTCGLHQLAPPAGVTCNHVTAYVGVLLVCPPPKPRHGPGPSAAIQQPCYELAPPPPRPARLAQRSLYVQAHSPSTCCAHGPQYTTFAMHMTHCTYTTHSCRRRKQCTPPSTPHARCVQHALKGRKACHAPAAPPYRNCWY